MGRHSIPDPEESSSGPRRRRRCDRAVRPAAGPPTTTGLPAGPGARLSAVRRTRYDDEPDRPAAALHEPDYPNPTTRVPRARVPTTPSYETDYSDDYESDYPESDYPVRILRSAGVPQAGYRDPKPTSPISSTRRGRRYAARTPEPKAPPRASHSAGMGGRRVDRQPPRNPSRPQRGVSVGVIVALVTVVVVVGGDSSCGGSSVTRCRTGRRSPPHGASTARSPSPSSPIRRSPTRSATLAEKYNQTAAPGRRQAASRSASKRPNPIR